MTEDRGGTNNIKGLHDEGLDELILELESELATDRLLGEVISKLSSSVARLKSEIDGLSNAINEGI